MESRTAIVVDLSCPSLTLQQLSTTRKSFANIVAGAFTPMLAKYTKSFNLVDTLSVGVDRIQRNFEPMQRQVENWRETQIIDARAKLIFYSAFVEASWTLPRACCPKFIGRTSSHNTRSSRREPCGASPTRSKYSIRFRYSYASRSLHRKSSE